MSAFGRNDHLGALFTHFFQYGVFTFIEQPSHIRSFRVTAFARFNDSRQLAQDTIYSMLHNPTPKRRAQCDLRTRYDL